VRVPVYLAVFLCGICFQSGPLRASPLVVAPVRDFMPADPLVLTSLVITEVPSLSQADVTGGQTGQVTFRLTNLTAQPVDLMGATLVGSTSMFPNAAGGVTSTLVAPGGCLESELMPGQECLYQQTFQTGLTRPVGTLQLAGGLPFVGTSMLYNRVMYQVMGNPIQVGNAFGVALVSVDASPVPEASTGLYMWIGLLLVSVRAHPWARKASSARS
jgi:hypothetical protein